ncbi:MAG: site-2 protease family protein [Acidobacteria bacterium]|nr:site-2 protease family protein [Acidobacteriota bacterium]
MHPQDFSAAPQPFPAGEAPRLHWEYTAGTRRERYWLHAVLFVLTLLTTTVVGAGLAYDFARNVPFDVEQGMEMMRRIWTHPHLLLDGLPFSLTLMTILGAHELGHYIACRYYNVDATLPFFLPGPPFLTGTFGAVIRIRSAIYSKRALFDIGVAGPLAGFVFLLPALAVGLAFSKVVPGITQQGTIQFGVPLLQQLLQHAIFPGVPTGDLYLHPVARAAWIAILATALNLLPIGQLDGGHILYSLMGDRHRLMSKIFIALLVPMGIFGWWGWLFWAVVLFFVGRKHPVIYDTSPLGAERTGLGWLSMVIFLLCFTFSPVSAGGL